MIPVGEIWKNRNFRKNVKAYAKISEKNKKQKIGNFQNGSKGFFLNGKLRYSARIYDIIFYNAKSFI